MFKSCTYMLAAIAVMFSLAVYGADPVVEKGGTQSIPESRDVAESQKISIAEEMARNPVKFLRGAIQADSMGYVSAVVYNPTSVTVANVVVRLVRFDAETRQPNAQMQLLIESSIGPNQTGQVKVENLQVFKAEEMKLYRVMVEQAALIK